MTDNPVAQNDIPGIAFAARSVDSLGDPLDPIEFSPGGDLYTVVLATPSGTLRNLTADLTNGEGDVSDPEVFPQTDEDQFRLVFAMKRNSADQWHRHEVAAGSSRTADPVQLTCDNANEVDPYYLPDGRVVFSSDRPGHLDDYERRRSTVLHMLDRSRAAVQSTGVRQRRGRPDFVQSKPRPKPLRAEDGTILFSRWEHVGGANKFPIFVMEPDGTDLFVTYGSHSGVNAYMDHAPLEQAPASRIKTWKFPHLYDGIIVVTYLFVFFPV